MSGLPPPSGRSPQAYAGDAFGPRFRGYAVEPLRVSSLTGFNRYRKRRTGMSDWQVGDLAVCVDAFHWERPDLLAEGRIYNVSGISELGGLFMREIAPPAWAWGGFRPDRFRKILPDQHEPCEAEFITLLKRSKTPEHTTLTGAT